MIKFFTNLETSLKLIMFFFTLISGLFLFSIRSTIKISKSVELIHNSQTELEELVKYKNITIGSFVDKQYEKVIKGEVEDIKESDLQVLTLYSQNLILPIEIMYKINKIINSVSVVK